MDSSKENVIRRNAGRKMLLRDDAWKGQCIRLRAKNAPRRRLPAFVDEFNESFVLLVTDMNPLCCWSLT
jgi:hypothetical protein